MSKVFTFRVHFADGAKIDVEAATPEAARSIARKTRNDGEGVVKIKRVRS